MTAREPSRHALTFIFITLLIDMIGFGIVIPVFPQLIVDLTGRVVNEAARIGGWLAFTYAIMQFLCGPLIGNLSDRFGRRPVLLLALLAFAVDYALMAFAPTIGWLFLGRLIAGITGASYVTGYAYVADISPPEKRAQNFGLLGLAFGLGFILGPAIGGLLGSFGTRAPFLVAGGLALLNAIYGFLVVPESLGLDRRRPFDIRRANPAGALVQIRHYHASVLWIAGALFLWAFACQSLQSAWNFYVAYRFNWTTAQIGLSLAAVGISAAIVQGGLTRILIPKFGEARAILIGLCFGAAAFVVYASATEGWLMYVGIAIGALAGLVFPSMNASMSHHVQSDAQGELQGAVSSLMSLASIIGPPAMTQSFAFFTSAGAPLHLPGAPYLLAALLTVLSLLLILRAQRPVA